GGHPGRAPAGQRRRTVPAAAPDAAAGGRPRRRRGGRRAGADPAPAVLQAGRGVPAPGDLRPADDPRRRDPLSVGPLPADGERAVRKLRQRQHRRVALPDLQLPGYRGGWPGRRLPVGVHLSDALWCGAAGHVARYADVRRPRRECQPGVRASLHARLSHGRPRRGHHRPQPVGRARHGRGCADPVVHRRGGGRPRQPGGRAARGPDRRGGARGGHRVVPGDRAGRPLPHRRRGPAGPARRALRPRMSAGTTVALEHRSPLRSLRWALPALVILVALPWVADQYQTILLAYGLVMGIAALGFNLLLGYTGLLSFGHSAYFGVGAYSVALMVKYLGVTSMELFL